MNLLIVDDHLTNLKLLRAQLESEGHTVFDAHDGVDALALLERQHMDVVISDILMPRMDGYQLCREIRKHARLHDLPTITYSSTYTAPGDEKLALEMGADKYLKKPASVATIAAALHEVIAQPHATQRPDALREVEVLKEYSDRLVSKLKEKNTELLAQTEALRESEERFRTVVETAPEAIYIQINRRFAYVNAAALRFFGATRPEELLGQPVLDRFHPDFRAKVEERIRLVNEDRQSVTSVDEVYLTLAGSPKDVNISAVPFTYQNQNGALVFVRDITEHRKLEAQFRQAQKMEAIGHLAGGVAHDFNNILAVIQGYYDLLIIDGNLSPAQADYTDQIGAAAQRAAVLTRQLLLFSRKETLRLGDLDLNQSINEMTKILRRTLGEHIELQFKFALQPLFIHADAGMMDQVLMNLAVNARDAMPKGGRLVIETSVVDFDESVRAHSTHAHPGSFVCLSVSDTGCGIPPENLSRIFEPFFTTKDIGKGTGLGLATVFGIVQQHQGWIEFQSEVGRGTTFRIYISRLAKMPEQKPEPPALTAIRGGNETILLVEDDVFLRASVNTILSRLGYRVLEAVNGVEALEVWKQHRDEIHLVLTDMLMPGGINGKELGEQLLQQDPKLKVIYVSGYSADIVGKDFSLEEGVNFLAKPFAANKLAQIVRNCLDKI
jgi:PAS domain S-box-containing protein